MMVEGAAVSGGFGLDAMTTSKDCTGNTEAEIEDGAAHAHDPPSQQGMSWGAGGFSLLGAVPPWCSGQSAGIGDTAGVEPSWQLPAPVRCAHAIGPPPRLTSVANTIRNHLARLDRI
jgi:hypothetical protein